ncbi:MAG: hypothetical protein HQ513_11265 [Rhodospirillales bacterium]|nr:hypothetical protein [Rhodospirillales bacterium]
MAKTTKSRAAKCPSPRGRQTLKGRMADIRQALTSLGVRNGHEDLFLSTLEQLDALGDEIAGATDRMMTATETIQDAATAIGAKSKERATKNQLKKIDKGCGDVFEACSFQDITGQRLGKITRTVTVIEDSVRTVSALAGGKGKGRVGKSHAIDRMDGNVALEGPQIDGPAVSQDEINKLFD